MHRQQKQFMQAHTKGFKTIIFLRIFIQQYRLNLYLRFNLFTYKFY